MPDMSTMPNISTIVITYNEERNIERCLKSVSAFSHEIVVVDSLSTDRTIEIARQHGARVISHEWLGYGRQKKLALENTANTWVFSIDADEEVSADLSDEIQTLDFEHDGYEIPRTGWYINRWIKHGVWYPGYLLRLFRKDKGTFTDDVVHESAHVSGSTARLKNDLLHYTYRDMAHHIEKMNDFTTLSARQMYEQGRRAGVGKIAVTPLLEFLRVYIAKRGFLDGFAGFAVSVLHSKYVFLKYAKLRELSIRSASPASAANGESEKTVEAGR
jgi:glycosyltransferase involved in cell wall biosynthesis